MRQPRADVSGRDSFIFDNQDTSTRHASFSVSRANVGRLRGQYP
jgi:hypothetical protein